MHPFPRGSTRGAYSRVTSDVAERARRPFQLSPLRGLKDQIASW